MNYCLATSRDNPNMTTNSRGRKYHLTLDKKLSLCKGIVSELIGSQKQVFDKNGQNNGRGLSWAPTQHAQGLCGNCRNIAKQRNIKYTLMGY